VSTSGFGPVQHLFDVLLLPFVQEVLYGLLLNNYIAG
jgi:hypothetical protein